MKSIKPPAVVLAIRGNSIGGNFVFRKIRAQKRKEHVSADVVFRADDALAGKVPLAVFNRRFEFGILDWFRFGNRKPALRFLPDKIFNVVYPVFFYKRLREENIESFVEFFLREDRPEFDFIHGNG